MYDHDFKYGENFYVCVTEEAKELVLNVSRWQGKGWVDGLYRHTQVAIRYTHFSSTNIPCSMYRVYNTICRTGSYV